MDNEENPSRFGPKYFPDPGMFGQMEGFGNHFPQQHQLPFGQTAINQRSAVSQQMQSSTFPFSNQRMNLLPSPNFSPQTSAGFNPWSMYYPSPQTSAPPDTAILSGRYPAGDLNNQIRSPSLFQGYYQANTLDDPRIQRQSQMDQANVFRSGMTRERDMYMEQLREESIKKERENQILRELEIQRQKDRELQLMKKQEEERQKLSEFHHLRQQQPQLNQQATQFFSRSQPSEIHSNIFSQQSSFGNVIPQSFIKTDPRTTKPAYPSYSQSLDSNQKSPLIKARRPDIFPPVLDSFKDQSERMKYFSSVADNPKNSLNDIFSFNFAEGSNFSSNMKSSVAEIKQSLMKSINSSHLNKSNSQNPKDFSHFDDIDLAVDRHMSPIRFNTSEVNSHKSREDSILENFPSILGSSDGTSFPNMSKPSHESQNFGIKSQTASNFNIETNLNHASAHTEPQMFSGGAETSSSYYKDEPKVSFSQRSKIQVTQNSAVNINININMPPTPHFPFHLGGISASPKEMKGKADKTPVQSQGNVQTSSYSVQHPNKATTDTSVEKNEIITKSHSYESCTVSSSTTSCSKTTFGSIESFLGMNDIGNNCVSSSVESEVKTITSKGDSPVESLVSVRQSKNVSQNVKTSSKSEQFSKSSVIDGKSEYVIPHLKFASESPITSENLMISEKTLKKADNRESVPAGFKEVKVSENLPQNSQVLDESKNHERMSVIIPLATATKVIDMTTNREEKEKSASKKEIKSPSHSKKTSPCDEVFSHSSAASLLHPSLRMNNEASKRDITSVKDDAISKTKHEAQQHKVCREEDMKQDQGNNVKILHPSLRLQKRGRSGDTSFSADIPSEIITTPITNKEISVAEVDEVKVKESSSNPRNPKLVSYLKSHNSKTLEENDKKSNKGYSESSMSSLIAAIQQDVMRNKNKQNSQDFLDETEIFQNENNAVYQNENESEKSNGENNVGKISETEMMDDEMNETNCSSKSENPSFDFRNITFEENCDDTNQDDSSSESEYSDEAEETKDSECGTEDHEGKLQGSRIASNRKRSANHSAELIASLKKRKTIDEDLIKIPLDHGWMRQTRLRICGPKETIRGDVYYYSPCGKKLRTYPEINAYIKKEEIEDVQLEHFSFSTKVKVGDFLESKQGSKFEKLTEDQVQDRFDKMNEKVKELEKKAMERSAMKQKKMEELKRLQEEKERVKEEQQAMKKAKEEERKRLAQKKADDLKLKKQREAEALREAKRQKEESLMLKKLEKKAALEALRIAKEERIQRNLEAKRKQKEQKEKERQEKLEQQRLRKEWRQQMVENEKEKKRQQLNVSKVKEKQKKKHEHVMMKANEARRKAEERERQKEQRRLEKTLEKQKKIEQKRFSRMIVKELKKPIDDMALADLRPLPEIPRVKNLCISGKAYANLLMVYEFVHSFGHVIDIDPNDDFPDMAELQSALLGEYNDEENVFNSCCQSLLYIALFDPGISGKYSKTSLGVDLKDVDLNESNISEVLRLFILSRSEGKQHLSDQLSTMPLASLSPEDKSSVLAFLCDELLCGKAIGREIEANLDTMSNLRREKWSLEGQLRKLKQDVLKKKPKQVKQQDENDDEENESEEEKESEDEEEPIEEGDTMEEDENDGKMSDADGSLTQAEKELKKMEKKHAKFRSKLFKASQAVRGIYLGQDRFKRRYYILPNGGGIFVEGLESGYFNECPDSAETQVKQEESGNLTNEGKIDSNHCDIMKQKELKPTSNKNSTDTKIFSLFHSRKCDSNKRTTTRFSQDQFQVNNSKKVIISPNVRSLNNDTKFLESVCTFYTSTSGQIENHSAVQSTEQGTITSYIKEEPSNSGESNLPFKLDLHKLMHEDRQKAVELLQQQSWHQKDIPSAMKHGWWKIYTKEQLDSIVKALHPRGTRERHFQKSINRIMEYAVASVKKDVDAFSLELSEEDNKEESKYVPQITPDGRIPDQWYPELAYAVDKAVLIEVEELEEKVFSASLQTKGLRLPQKVSPSLNYKESFIQDIKEEKNPIRVAAKRLLQLEEGIERRYLKHPFKKSESADQSKDDTLKNSNFQETTAALLLWRKVVNEVSSGAQLSICINMLNECIGWEKSIMKVFCILCRKSDNEERLLLCDACDRGCHTYCCKPKLENIPEGDWFCQECVLMASGSDQCYKCKAKSGKRLKCAHCPRHYHLQCLEPPLQKTPRSPWSCPVCKKLRAKSNPSLSKKRPKPEDVNKKEDRIKTKLPNQTKLPKDMEICKDMLDELEAHKMAWPFLVAVNAKQFPEYYKVIRHPMNFSTMRTKLLELQYQSNEEFARDARLVFKNCNIFNEDDSEIGRAGKTMLSFFEKRWRQLVNTNVCENKTVQAINVLQEVPEEGDSYIETEEEEEEVEIEDSSEMETSSSDSENSDTNNESGENMQ